MFKKGLHFSGSFIPRFVILTIMLSAAILPAPKPVEASTSIPTISIVNVVGQTSVTIRTHSWPANEVFTIRMGKYGTYGLDGEIVATTNSGAGGEFEVTYPIPEYLKYDAFVAIRVDSSTGYYYCFNWFTNNIVPAQSPETEPAAEAAAPSTTYYYTGVPSFSISAVEQDTSVTIKAINFPPDQTFTVLMADLANNAVNGTSVGTTGSGKEGEFEATYKIPESLKGSSQISIRMDSPLGYYSYNWFYNQSLQ